MPDRLSDASPYSLNYSILMCQRLFRGPSTPLTLISVDFELLWFTLIPGRAGKPK